jgi:hypothetical protein
MEAGAKGTASTEKAPQDEDRPSAVQQAAARVAGSLSARKDKGVPLRFSELSPAQRAARLREVEPYLDRYVPVVCEPQPGSRLAGVPPARFLCPRDMLVSALLLSLRRHLARARASEEKKKDEDEPRGRRGLRGLWAGGGREALYMLFGDPPVLAAAGETLGGLYDAKGQDGFLYVTFAPESTFGF